jgi:Nif-specific regulatory protein
LLLGESGTGKEVFARAIHQWSDRSGEPFIAINCVGLGKELLESEFFGHEKGSFTGAHQLKKGKMQLAHGGTVFLDEVGDISAELQTKLLRFLKSVSLSASVAPSRFTSMSG